MLWIFITIFAQSGSAHYFRVEVTAAFPSSLAFPLLVPFGLGKENRFLPWTVGGRGADSLQRQEMRASRRPRRASSQLEDEGQGGRPGPIKDLSITQVTSEQLAAAQWPYLSLENCRPVWKTESCLDSPGPVGSLWSSIQYLLLPPRRRRRKNQVIWKPGNGQCNWFSHQ